MLEEVSQRHKSWEGFWRQISKDGRPALWDVAPERAAALDAAVFLPRLHPGAALPLVDVGCGSGAQTVFWSTQVDRVLGVDLASAAIAAARAEHGAHNIDYRVLDILQRDQCAQLHDEIGDANLYIRGVLHQLSAAERPVAMSGIAQLMGHRGVLCLVEPAPRHTNLFAELAAHFGEPPPEIARIIEHGITPAMLVPGEIESLARAGGQEIIACGERVIHTVRPLPTGEPLEIPASYWLIRQRSRAAE